MVDKIVAAIEAFAGQKENSTTESIEVAPEKHRMLIGRGGEVRRALESIQNWPGYPKAVTARACPLPSQTFWAARRR